MARTTFEPTAPPAPTGSGSPSASPWESLFGPAGDDGEGQVIDAEVITEAPTLPDVPEAPADLLADLDEPNLVLTPGYIGAERRAAGARARLRRATFDHRRRLHRLAALVVLLLVLAVTAALVAVNAGSTEPAASSTLTVPSAASNADANPFLRPVLSPTAIDPHKSRPAPAHAAAVPAPTTTTPTTVAPPAPAAPAAVAPAAVASAPAPAPAPPSTADLTPDQMGAAALALVRYPWQNIPGYSIQFLPISDAPSAGFYGNTTFTWGSAGGTSVLYVYPGETVDELAGITAFEIGHEVDAAAVYPQGGETAIENILGIHPASWAPDCDCAEQGFLSGWYASAFSNYWSPGVGDWSQIAPEPSGAVLAAVEPWLNPSIP